MKQFAALGAVILVVLGSCAAPIEQAVAPAPSCRLPAAVTPAPAYRPPADEVVADEPAAFYMLALTWAPQDCRANGDDPRYAIQCRDNDFGFVLHGLWPNGAERRHPRYCGPAPAISPDTVRKHSCMTPAPVMLQHEWAAHGTCGWTTPEAYFDQAAALWRGLQMPELASTMTAGEIRDAFAKANPAFPREGIYLKTAEGSRLEDLRICYDLKYRPMACKSRGAPDDAVVRIEPRRAR